MIREQLLFIQHFIFLQFVVDAKFIPEHWVQWGSHAGRDTPSEYIHRLVQSTWFSFNQAASSHLQSHKHEHMHTHTTYKRVLKFVPICPISMISIKAVSMCGAKIRSDCQLWLVKTRWRDWALTWYLYNDRPKPLEKCPMVKRLFLIDSWKKKISV